MWNVRSVFCISNFTATKEENERLEQEISQLSHQITDQLKSKLVVVLNLYTCTCSSLKGLTLESANGKCLIMNTLSPLVLVYSRNVVNHHEVLPFIFDTDNG